MPRIAYFDCFSGISGDMTIAALIDAGLDFKRLSSGLAKLKLGGYALRKSRVTRGGLSGTRFECVTKRAGHSHMTLKGIFALIDKSALKPAVKATAAKIFTLIGQAEAKVHGSARWRDVHLHEVGQVDSIIDIVGAAIALDMLGIDEVHASVITTGRTVVDTNGGRLPVPAPAALELLRGVPLEVAEVRAELITPTGAAILAALSRSFGRPPRFRAERIGYGAGSRELAHAPNMLRVVIGEACAAPAYGQGSVVVIETNIDDMPPNHFEPVFERLFAEGALDAFVTNILMKKSRPAFKLTVLARKRDFERISDCVLTHTTAIGLRYYEAGRFMLERKIGIARTRYGNIKVKYAGSAGKALNALPEYEDCARAARARGIPFKIIYNEAKKRIGQQ